MKEKNQRPGWMLIPKSLLMQLIFWLMVFAFSRALYVMYNLRFAQDAGFIDFAGLVWHPLRLDLSAASYLLLLPFLVSLVQCFYSPGWLDKMIRVYVLIFLFLLCLLHTAEMGVYAEWKSKLHYKALLYVAHPREITSTAPAGQLLGLTGIFIIQFGMLGWLYIRFFHIKVAGIVRRYFLSAIWMVIMPLLLLLGLRGGWQQIPVNQGESMYSSYPLLNNASVNSAWNLMNSIQQNYSLLKSNPFEFYPGPEAEKTVRELHVVADDSVTMILKNPGCNIVMLILEGWSADLVESLGGKPGITPFFKKMESSGVLFTDVYSSGTRSQQGMSALFSGFPAHPLTTITEQPEKCAKLPSLSKELKKAGYYNAYYFGGQLIYGNIKGYLQGQDFDRIVEGSGFPPDIPRGKLGIHDEYTFPYFIHEIEKMPRPFFASIFTMSTHSPYDMKMRSNITWPVLEREYVNAAYYTDDCLREFFAMAEKQDWYSNTLFVLISDHGHSSYINRDYFSPEYHKIVWLLYGEVIRDEYRGLKIGKTGSQVDLAATILGQTGHDAKSFVWSKNLLNPGAPAFAFCGFENGMAWVRPGSVYVYDAGTRNDYRIEVKPGSAFSGQQIKKEGLSYLQVLFQQYMDY